MRRRLLIFFVVLGAGTVLAVATLPYWLGAAVRLGGRSRGLTFGAYETIGYGRFALRDAEFRRGNVRVAVARAEADTPVLWLWRRWTQHPSAIVAGGWRVDVAAPTPAPAPARNPGAARGWMPLRALLQRIAVQLDHWLPVAEAGAGVVRWPGGELAIGSARWERRELAVTGFAYRALHADATLAFAPEDVLRLVARTPGPGGLAAKLESRGASVRGNAAWAEQPATLEATFGAQGWLPAAAVLQAAAWTVPADRLKLGELYSAVRGSARVEWRAGRFGADIVASGEPVPDKAAPPLDLALRGSGDLEAFSIESLRATLPGVNARLSEPVTIERSGRIRESAARFALQADLARLPWLAAEGTVNGEARLVSGFAASPVVEFSLDARGIRAREVALSALHAKGRLAWPQLVVTEASVAGGAGERLDGHGGWDFRRREVLEAAVQGAVRRATFARWLPREPEFDEVKLTARAAGPIAAVAHEGSAQAAGVKAPGVNPLALALEWRGHGAALDEFKATASAGTSRLQAAGAADASSVRLTALEFAQGGESRLRLAEPATLRWRPALQLEALRLAGPEGSMSVDATAGEAGRINLAASRISSAWFSDFVAIPGPPSQLSLLALTGLWERGPMVFSLSAGASLDLGEGRSAAVNLSARGDQDGVRIDALRAAESTATVINATGQLPVTFSPGLGDFLRIDPNGALRLEASVAPNSAFWPKLATMTGVELKEPQAAAHLKGTWQRPEGGASLQAARIAIDPKRVARPLPTMEALDVQLTGDRGGVTLSRFAVSIEGQPVRAQGRLPIPDGQWTALFKQPLAAAQKGGDLHVEVPDAEIAVFARFLPSVLAPKGRLQADVHYKGGGLAGFLKLRDAASRPLGPLGVVQEISADVALAGRKFTLRELTAKSGGQPVTLTGTVELPENGAPRFDLALKGENLPFVRQTGLLIRGDLDLKLQTPGGGAPRLSGNVRLRDSLFLSDVRSFLPKGTTASPARRPPYFAIETPPVNAWTLAVDVAGERFLRLRTPVFAGVASAHFRLGGTLGEPRAVGEVAIDEGAVRMPFASFAVAQGSVRLTEADPYEPAVYLRGTARRYGYDLTMEIDGNASQPNVVFSSSPALDSEQVLLMVMTGTSPRNEITNSTTQRFANIGYFLGQSLLGSLGTDAADADRLSIASGEKVSIQGKETYDIEYKLSDRWTLTGEYNEFDEYAAGVKWRVLRGERPGEKKENARK